MRLLAVTLAFALLSLGFAPAPFPKADRAATRGSEAALVRECLRRLDELGVGWEIVERGGSVQPGDGNLLRVLRRVVEDAEQSLNPKGEGRER